MTEIVIHHSRLQLVEGDITRQAVDAIVNAANHHLAGGGGVDGAIHRAGGSAIMQETKQRYPDGCPTGSAVISGAGELDARFVIHAVGPIWSGGQQGEAGLLAAAYHRCLELAVENDCHSIAFPALSAGAYGYPLDEAAAVAVRSVASFLADCDVGLSVTFVLFGPEAFASFSRAMRQLEA
jgi:O-acetyl-ADP-ribose deacetylase (regulator of RNase III)